MSKSITLRQTFEEPIYGFFDNGPKRIFDWSIDRVYPDGKSRVGSWGANYYFEVVTGKTDKVTLGNARRALAARAKRNSKACSFEYIEEEE